MDITIKPNTRFIFDLDDTLFNEYDFLISGFNAVSDLFKEKASEVFANMIMWHQEHLNVFEMVQSTFSSTISVQQMLDVYRFHMPNISIKSQDFKVLETLKFNGHFLGLLTDGRSITQRNKLKALGLEDFFDQLVISEEFGSEKPNIKNYKSFIVESVQSYVIIADNTSKDFITANILNWTSIGILDNGSNIHKQQFDLDNIYLPKYWVKSISEINFIYEH